jgi:hypothetical protein
MRPTKNPKDIWQEALQLFVICLALNYLLSIVDNTPRFYFGDSASYLSSRFGGSLPTDRSWTYGVAIHWIMATTGSLSSVLLLQGVLITIALSAIGAVLRFETGISWSGIVFCVIGIVNPVTFYYQRAILTDLPAASFFLLSLFFLYRLLSSERTGRFKIFLDMVGLALTVAAALSLRTAYLPVSAGLCLLCLLAAAASHRFPTLPKLKPSTSFAGALSIVVGAATVLTVNNALHPTMGFSLNSRASEFLLATFAPAIRRSMLTAEGFHIDRITYRQFGLKDFGRRPRQIFKKDGLVETLNAQMTGLSNDQIRSRHHRLIWRLMEENPLGVAKIIGWQILMHLDPRAYFHGITGDLNHRTFDDGFVERFVHNEAWEKLDQKLPAETTFSVIFLRKAILLPWLQYMISLLAPLGIINARLRGSLLYVLFAMTASGYALSTILFSTELTVRYFLLLVFLSVAIVILTIPLMREQSWSGFRPWRRSAWQAQLSDTC